jgi:hypothetical protein
MQIKLTTVYISLFVLAGLAGCGSGGIGPDAPQVSKEPEAVTIPTVTRGFYSGTLDSKEILSFVTPDQDFFALHFRSSTNPDIYSGKLSMGLNGAANVTNAGLRAYVGGGLKLGTASLTNSSLQTFSGIFNVASQLPLNFTVSAPATDVYQVSSEASLSALQGSWAGTWSDGLSTTGVSSPFTIAISSSGAMTLSTSSTVNSCQLSASLTPISTVNIYKVALTIPLLTGCVRTDGKFSELMLNGVAVIYKSPIAGKTSRLELMAVDASGSGMSFRGDR